MIDDKDRKATKRIQFWPSDKQYDRINSLFMRSNQYKTMSELLRQVFEIGLKTLENNEDLFDYKRGIEK